jgi:hypothetical protein
VRITNVYIKLGWFERTHSPKWRFNIKLFNFLVFRPQENVMALKSEMLISAIY